MKNRFLLFCLMCLLTLGTFAQPKQLQFSAQVSDKNEPLSFGVIYLKYKGQQIGGLQLNFDGKGTFALADSIDLKYLTGEIRCPGFKTSTITFKRNQLSYSLLIPEVDPYSTTNPSAPNWLTNPGQYYYDAEFIQHSAYRFP